MEFIRYMFLYLAEGRRALSLMYLGTNLEGCPWAFRHIHTIQYFFILLRMLPPVENRSQQTILFLWAQVDPRKEVLILFTL